MKICVCVKSVPDTEATIRITGTNRFEEADVRFIPNPYDEYALEEAVSLVEKHGGEVVMFTVGNDTAVNMIRGAMAMGVDRAVLIRTDAQFLDSDMTARALSAAIEQDGRPDLVFTGKSAVDTEGFQTPYRIAGYLDMPVINDVSRLTIDNSVAVAEKEAGAGTRQVLKMSLPCVIGTAKGLNEPRYPKFMEIMKAKKKPMQEIQMSALNIKASPATVTLEALEPVPERSGATMISGSLDEQVTELVRVLKETEKII